jgi:hypothetical protein
MSRYSAVNTYTFSSKFGIDTFLGYLRGTSGWNLTESSDRMHGRLEPELGGTRYEMEWVLEKNGSSNFKLKLDGTQLNGRCKQSDEVWDKLDSLWSRNK